MSAIIEALRWHRLRITPKTVWTFVEVVDSEKRIGTGEATLLGEESAVESAVRAREADIVGHAPSTIDLARARAAASSLAEFAAVSALDQALADVAAQQAGVAVAAWLDTVRRDAIDAYANINRGVRPRTPEAFAARARDAVAAGFHAVKLAPFDEVTIYGDPALTLDAEALDAGLARIAAVRDAVGDDIDVMVDCHWRLNETAAQAVLRACEPLRLHWLECPVPENVAMLPTIARLRSFANARGVRLAGCEEMSLVAGFAPYLSAGAYDVLMPDVKYAGGLREMLRIADAIERAGAFFSPHNPSGPVSHAASVHVCAVAPGLDRLEVQFAETPLFGALVAGALAPPRDGAFDVPRGPGLGVRLDTDLTRDLAIG